MDILWKIIEFIKITIALPVSLFTLFLIAAPNELLDKMSLTNFVSENKGVLWLIFLFSGLLYIHEKGKNFFELIKKKKIKKQIMGEIIRSLNSLSPQEYAVIYYCLRENKKTVIAHMGNSTLISLESKHIMQRPSGSYSILGVPFTISDGVWEYLLKNKNNFCPKEKLNDKQYNSEVNRFINDLRNVLRD